MPTAAPPCPQAARAPGVAPLPPPTLLNVVEDVPAVPRPVDQADALPRALVDQSVRWPYHLPSFNGLDCLWWAMLVRALYASDSTWVRRVAEWAQPVARLSFVDRTQPARQGYGLVELRDCVLVVVPGTSSEAEALAYFLTHSLRLVYTNIDFGWKINQAWATRGQQVLDAYLEWPPPSPHKPVIFIGHSSGAAYAAYCGYSAFSDPHQPNTIVNFGAPIWGTQSLSAFYVDRDKEPKTLDFGTPNDPVLAVPPAWAVVDLLGLRYPYADRITYARINPLLQLGGLSAPEPVSQPSTFDAVLAAIRSVLVGGQLGADHAPAAYTTAANKWAANDPSIDAEFMRPAYDALAVILTDMNTAGLY